MVDGFWMDGWDEDGWMDAWDCVVIVWMDGFSSWKDGMVNKLKYSRHFLLKSNCCFQAFELCER